MNTKVLHYIGREKGILPGVPARDLDYKEVKQFGGYSFLMSTGLYETIKSEDQQRRGRKRKIEDIEKESE